MASESEREYEFVLVLDGIQNVTPDIEDALFEAGCKDATVSIRLGRVYLTFARMARSLQDAVLTAINNVDAADIGATVLRVDECNLVTQSDIARRIGRSRQSVNQYIRGERGPGGFPPPACRIADNAPLWYWCEVSYWLWENDMIKESEYLEAQDISVINSVLDIERRRSRTPLAIQRILNSLRLCNSR